MPTYLFILKELQQRGNEIVSKSSDGCNGQDWAKLKPGNQKLHPGFPHGWQGLVRLPFAAFPRPRASSWAPSGAARTQEAIRAEGSGRQQQMTLVI